MPDKQYGKQQDFLSSGISETTKPFTGRRERMNILPLCANSINQPLSFVEEMRTLRLAQPYKCRSLLI
jgi:hypothetical protein